MKKILVEVIIAPVAWALGVLAVLMVIGLLAGRGVAWGIPSGAAILVWIYKFVFGIVEVAGLNKKRDDDLF